MLKLYTHIDLLTPENRPRVFPLLFDLHYVKNDFAQQFFYLTRSIENCDIAVFPIDYTFSLIHHAKKIKNFREIASKHKKKVWIYTGGDFGYSIDNEQVYNFRFGGFKTKLSPNDTIMPAFINDPYESYIQGSFVPLPKEKLPTIGFTGHATTGLLKYLVEFKNYLSLNLKRKFKKVLSDYQPFYPSAAYRFKYLKRIEREKNISSNFIYRKKYRAGATKEISKKHQTAQEFYDNIFNNLYTFCMRGGGNFSVRFYETLAAGRIPILLDTDCKLPLNKLIHWKKHCLIIDEKKISDMANQIITFHKSHSDRELKAIQKSNRQLWLNYLRRVFFFKHIHDQTTIEDTEGPKKGTCLFH